VYFNVNTVPLTRLINIAFCWWVSYVDLFGRSLDHVANSHYRNSSNSSRSLSTICVTFLRLSYCSESSIAGYFKWFLLMIRWSVYRFCHYQGIYTCACVVQYFSASSVASVVCPTLNTWYLWRNNSDTEFVRSCDLTRSIYYRTVKGKGKAHPRTGHEGPDGEYSSTLPLTSALDGDGWSTPRPGRFTPGKDPVFIVQEAWWAAGQVWTGAENFAPPPHRDFDPRTAQPVASRYTCWAIAVHYRTLQVI